MEQGTIELADIVKNFSLGSKALRFCKRCTRELSKNDVFYLGDLCWKCAGDDKVTEKKLWMDHRKNVMTYPDRFEELESFRYDHQRLAHPSTNLRMS